MRLTCIIDACSYIYLHQSSFTIGGEDFSLFKYLTRYVNIKQSNIVNEEISRNFNGAESALDRAKRNYNFRTRKYTLNDYDDKLFNGEIESESNDAGEKANLAVIIDSHLNQNKQGLVYLSDDIKAISNASSLSIIFKSFSFFPIWTSFEVIVYLYLVGYKKGFGYDMAKSSVRDLNSFIFNPQRIALIKKRDDGEITRDECSQKISEITQKSQSKIVEYESRLEVIRRLID